MASPKKQSLASILRDLRGERYSLRDVEELTGGVVSNVYLSQLETGKRSDPNPRVLIALAQAYDVPAAILFEHAGYVDPPPPSDVDTAFRQVLADKSFKFGTRVKGDVNDETKRFIIELYERATGKSLLGHRPRIRGHGTGTSSSP